MLATETVYNGTDNIIVLALKRELVDITHVSDDLPDLEADTHAHPVIARVKVVVDPIIDDHADSQITIDSLTNASWFDFTDLEYFKMRLGQANLKPGRHKAALIVYEATSVAGTRWGDLMLKVV